MKIWRREAYRIVAVCAAAVSFFGATSPAHASVMSDLSAGIENAVHFVSHDFLNALRGGFCGLYFSETEGGVWTSGDIRTKIGSAVCAGYAAPLPLAAASSSPLEGLEAASSGAFPAAPASLPAVNPLSTATPETITPGAYVGDTAESGTALDAEQILYWTNIERQSQGSGLSSLNENQTLDAIAKIRVEDMFAKGYFAHVSPSGDNVSKEADAAGYDYLTIGENIALGNWNGSRDLLLAWMASPGHRANILNQTYTDIGAYAEEGMYEGQEVWIASQVFGRPASSCPLPDASVKSAVTADKAELATLAGEITSGQNDLATMDKSDMDAYNAKVSAVNSLESEYNDLLAKTKALITSYNSQTDAYNACIAGD